MKNTKKETAKNNPKLCFFKVDVMPIVMGSCSSRALTSVQTCCGTCCC